jgi:hypothetical protein
VLLKECVEYGTYTVECHPYDVAWTSYRPYDSFRRRLELENKRKRYSTFHEAAFCYLHQQELTCAVQGTRLISRERKLHCEVDRQVRRAMRSLVQDNLLNRIAIWFIFKLCFRSLPEP